MLKRINRLQATRRIHFETTIASPFFLLLIKRNGETHNRYGFIISKRVDKKAVVRNRIKRIMTTCIGHMTTVLQGFDVLFLVKAQAKTIVSAQLCEAMQQALTKGGLFT